MPFPALHIDYTLIGVYGNTISARLRKKKCVLFFGRYRSTWGLNANSGEYFRLKVIHSWFATKVFSMNTLAVIKFPLCPRTFIVMRVRSGHSSTITVQLEARGAGIRPRHPGHDRKLRVATRSIFRVHSTTKIFCCYRRSVTSRVKSAVGFTNGKRTFP